MENKHQKTPKQNKALLAARKKILIQAVIAVQTVIIVAVLILGMSAAWYTNVLQTAGLQFEAAAWGFSGQVTVSNEPVQASPGQSGIIGLTVSNTGDAMVDVDVNVSKEQMSVPMRQRMFFYVDANQTRNGEVMNRVYINTRDSYTYSLLSHSQLVLSSERSNDAVLKWQWVYDMLGYYFLGTVTETTAVDNSKAVVSNVEDYLRPVEYDLDNATFADGMLSTVDGVTTEEFLEQLSLMDGYKNDITATDLPGYYQVDVDESGYGIWVYLCNWAEIQQATTYDSQLGKAAAEALLNGEQPERYVARLTVVGQATREELTEVSTADQLIAALEDGQMVQLQQNLTLTEPIALSSGEKLVMDLNGHTVTGVAGSSLLQLSDATNLIIMNGDIVAKDAGKDVISVSGSTLTLSNVSISGDGNDGIDIADQNGAVDSCVRLFDCEIDVAGCAVFVRGNGMASAGSTQVIVENTTLTSGYIGIVGNGNEESWGTDIQVYQSTITGYYAAIYQPQSDSVTKVTESTAQGMTGIVIKGGELEITDSKVRGTGQAQEPAYNNSGFTDTGDAVYVDGSYGRDMAVTITGSSTIVSDHALAVRVFEEDIDYASVIITSGNFSSDVSAFVPSGYAYDGTTGSVSPAPAEEGSGDET
jgi:hypothetical protein